MPWSFEEVQATHWWVKSHQQVRGLVTDNGVKMMGNMLGNAQTKGGVARSARGDTLPLPVPPMYGTSYVHNAVLCVPMCPIL